LMIPRAVKVLDKCLHHLHLHFLHLLLLPYHVNVRSVTSESKLEFREICAAEFANSCLTWIKFPQSIEVIRQHSFYKSEWLQEVSFELQSCFWQLKDSAFNCCTSLACIVIPESVQSIDEFRFSQCDALESIHFCIQLFRTWNHYRTSMTIYCIASRLLLFMTDGLRGDSESMLTCSIAQVPPQSMITPLSEIASSKRHEWFQSDGYDFLLEEWLPSTCEKGQLVLFNSDCHELCVRQPTMVCQWYQFRRWMEGTNNRSVSKNWDSDWDWVDSWGQRVEF
jgi:hypothetical protein